MAYEQKAGSGSLFRNDRKEKESHPDFKGDAMLPDGTMVWISAWVKQGKKGEFFSLSFQPKDEKPASALKTIAAPKPISNEPAFDDQIPF